MSENNKLVIFQNKQIRRIWSNNEWFFSVVDIIEALSESPHPRQYWEKVKQREFIAFQLSPIWLQLKLESSDGKKYSYRFPQMSPGLSGDFVFSKNHTSQFKTSYNWF